MEILVVLAGSILGALFIAAIVVPLALLRGWALSTLWGWFIVPIFHLPNLRIVDAIAVALVVGVLAPYSTSRKKEDGEKNYQPVVGALLTPLIAVGMGWILKAWM